MNGKNIKLGIYGGLAAGAVFGGPDGDDGNVAYDR